jgi:hypothetical protein
MAIDLRRLVLPLVVCWLQPALAADPPTLKLLEKTANQLASPLARERETGEQWLDAHGDAAFAELTRLMEQGNALQQTQSANFAAVFISPWSRGVLQGATHKGQVELFRLRRPVARPVGHPHAARIRAAALAALTKTLDSLREADRREGVKGGKQPGFPGWEHSDRVQTLCECLAEVADAATADKLAELLASEDNRYFAGHLMGALETYHGLPTSFTTGGICGLASPEEMKQFELSETRRCNTARTALLAWHKEHSKQPLAERTEAALDAWDKQLTTEEHHAYYNDSGDWTTQTRYATLIRLAEPAVDAMRKRAAKYAGGKYWQRGAYEIAIAAITGKVDKAYVAKLLAGEHFEQMLACEIVAAAGSREFKDELTALMQSQGPYKKASLTLAVIYRGDAIPILEKAHGDDFIATCAIAELRAWGG